MEQHLLYKRPSRYETAIIIELKVAKNLDELEAKAYEAIEQIVEKGYEEELRADGYKHIDKYGVAFFKKDCLAVK